MLIKPYKKGKLLPEQSNSPLHQPFYPQNQNALHTCPPISWEECYLKNSSLKKLGIPVNESISYEREKNLLGQLWNKAYIAVKSNLWKKKLNIYLLGRTKYILLIKGK